MGGFLGGSLLSSLLPWPAPGFMSRLSFRPWAGPVAVEDFGPACLVVPVASSGLCALALRSCPPTAGVLWEVCSRRARRSAAWSNLPWLLIHFAVGRGSFSGVFSHTGWSMMRSGDRLMINPKTLRALFTSWRTLLSPWWTPTASLLTSEWWAWGPAGFKYQCFLSSSDRPGRWSLVVSGVQSSSKTGLGYLAWTWRADSSMWLRQLMPQASARAAPVAWSRSSRIGRRTWSSGESGLCSSSVGDPLGGF